MALSLDGVISQLQKDKIVVQNTSLSLQLTAINQAENARLRVALITIFITQILTMTVITEEILSLLNHLRTSTLSLVEECAGVPPKIKSFLESELVSQPAVKHIIEPTLTDENGFFYWQFAEPTLPDEHEVKSKHGIIAHKTEDVPPKFEMAVLLGNCHDNGILSLRLMNICGSFVLTRIKEITNRSMLRHFGFHRDHVAHMTSALTQWDQLEISITMNMAKKFRALSQLDLMFGNTHPLEDQEQIIDNALKDLLAIYPLGDELETSGLGDPKNILNREIREREFLTQRLAALKTALNAINDNYDEKIQQANSLQREHLIAQKRQAISSTLYHAQREFYTRMLNNFQRNQSLVSRHQHIGGIIENPANSYALQDMFYAMQEYVPPYQTTVSPDQLHLGVDAHAVHSGQHFRHQKNALFTAHLAEIYETCDGLPIDGLRTQGDLVAPCSQLDHRRGAKDGKFQKLKDMRQRYDGDRVRIEETREAVREKRKKEKDKESSVELDSTSHLWANWRDSQYTRAQRQKRTQTCLACVMPKEKEQKKKGDKADKADETPLSLHDSLSVAQSQATKNTFESQEARAIEAIELHTKQHQVSLGDKSYSVRLAQAVAQGHLKTPVLPRPTLQVQSSDALTAALSFAIAFMRFFDHQMMAKRPLVSAVAFSIPYLQFSAAALAGGHGILALIAEKLAAIEAKILLGKVSAQSITGTIKTVDDALIWFTDAKGAFEVMIICGFTVSKAIYTIADGVFNGLDPNGKGQSLIQELTNKLSSGEIISKGGVESATDMAAGVGKFLVCAALAVAIGLGAAVTKASAVEFFDNIPVHLITHPSVQTIGAVKTAAVVIGKLMGVDYYIKQGVLVDLDGKLIEDKSPSAELLKFFIQYVEDKEYRNTINPETEEFKQLKREFENLLVVNPHLMRFFDQNKLQDANIKDAKAKWYKRFAVSVGQTFYFVANFVFLPKYFYDCYQFYQCHKQGLEVPPLLRQRVLVPLQWIQLTGLFLWTAAKAVVHSFLEVLSRVPNIVVGVVEAFAMAVYTVIGGLIRAAQALISGLNWLWNKVSCKKEAEVEVVQSIQEHQALDADSDFTQEQREQQVIEQQLEEERDWFWKGYQWIHELFVPAQVAISEVRLGVKHAVTSALTSGRDVTIRKTQEALQQDRTHVDAPIEDDAQQKDEDDIAPVVSPKLGKRQSDSS